MGVDANVDVDVDKEVEGTEHTCLACDRLFESVFEHRDNYYHHQA